MLRRKFIAATGTIAAGSLITLGWIGRSSIKLVERTIPATGETIPVVGMGSWLTFDVGSSVKGREQMGKVLEAFVKNGGKLVDSSPMYGSSEQVIGDLAIKLGILDQLWIATKVWTYGELNGLKQIKASQRYFHDRIILNQIHNLRDLEVHHRSLRQMKATGLIKYIGLTHYVNRQHDALAAALKKYEVDFIQVNYNIENPHAEEQLLSTAADQGVAVLINRPFQTGRLFRVVNGKPLPEWIADHGVTSWATYFLKYIISNPHVTCTIPATTQVPHVIENLQAATGWLPNVKERNLMKTYFQSII